jgi:hypothetical protein
MTPKEKASRLVADFIKHSRAEKDIKPIQSAKKCALIAVDYIITSNPHSNPFNTDVYSTMDYWQEVKKEIEKL